MAPSLINTVIKLNQPAIVIFGIAISVVIYLMTFIDIVVVFISFISRL